MAQTPIFVRFFIDATGRTRTFDIRLNRAAPYQLGDGCKLPLPAGLWWLSHEMRIQKTCAHCCIHLLGLCVVCWLNSPEFFAGVQMAILIFPAGRVMPVSRVQ